MTYFMVDSAKNIAKTFKQTYIVWLVIEMICKLKISEVDQTDLLPW